MKQARFNARCPFEIGDRIQDAKTGRVRTITDILCLHFLKSMRIEFAYELDNSGEFVKIRNTGKVKESYVGISI